MLFTVNPSWPESARHLLAQAALVLHAANGTVAVNSLQSFLTSAAWREDALRRCDDAPSVPMERNDLKVLQHYWNKEFPALPEQVRANLVDTALTMLDEHDE